MGSELYCKRINTNDIARGLTFGLRCTGIEAGMSSRKDWPVMDYGTAVRPRKSGWATPLAGLIALTIVVAFVLLVILLLAIMLIRHGSMGIPL